MNLVAYMIRQYGMRYMPTDVYGMGTRLDIKLFKTNADAKSLPIFY